MTTATSTRNIGKLERFITSLGRVNGTTWLLSPFLPAIHVSLARTDALRPKEES